MMLHFDTQTVLRRGMAAVHVERPVGSGTIRKLERLDARVQEVQDTDDCDAGVDFWLMVTPLGFERFILPRRGGR